MAVGFFIAAVILFAPALGSVSSAQASSDYEDSECYLGNVPAFDARDQIRPGSYAIYAKLARRGQLAPVTLYIEDNGASACQLVGSIEANGETWQRVGTWDSIDDAPVRFQLSSPAFTYELDANRPSIMLLPLTSPPCQPVVNCELEYEGQPAYLVPTSTLLSENQLRVQQVKDLQSDRLVQVGYFSDGQLLYTTPKLEPFDLRYVRGGDHDLSRVLQFESGQRVVLPSTARISFARDFQNLLFRLFHSNRIGLQILATLIILSLVAMITLAAIRTLHRRRIWKLSHGLLRPSPSKLQPQQQLPANYVPPAHKFIAEDSALIKRVKQFMPYVFAAICIVVAIGVIDTYVGQLFKVDGPSMENTLQTDDLIYVNRLPKTWATINGGEFVPKRGQVVVFQKAHSELFIQESQGEENTYVVKRVLGLPGERVLIKNGKITIFNRDHPGGFNPDDNSDWQATYIVDPNENIDLTLNQSEIFVTGDNRPESLDSRTNGPININELIGVAEARLLPFSKRQTL